MHGEWATVPERELFERKPLRPEKKSEERREPLPARMRPETPDEFVGQEHFFGKGKLLRRMLESDTITSVIFYGPPGTGKTALAHVIAGHTRAHFVRLNATSANVQDLRSTIEEASARERLEGGRTILFLDELHRFNRAQQDVLLPDVESGLIILIGATTHNPYFAINSPLLSRSQIFEFKPLSDDELSTVMNRALADRDRGLGNYEIEMTDEARRHLIAMCDGDARRLLSSMEVGALTGRNKNGKIVFDLALAEDCIQKKALVYDREDAHYDAASAFIKSMRGSDPDAALYWMAVMLEGGEDPRFIARRVVICAAEDVGNADPRALILANAALGALEFVGMPEGRIPLAQAVTYIATAPKSNASYMAIDSAIGDVKEGRTLAVPDHLKDASYPGAKDLGRGEDYKYAHSYEDHWVNQQYKPGDAVYYKPTEQGYEKTIKERLERWKKKKSEKK